jgi:amiloride-sensitive sodium channel subunit beta
MFIFCKFNTKPCIQKDFKWYFDFDYGNCYKYNFDINKLDYVGKNGMQASLRLELSVGNYMYPEPYVYNRGLRIVIHNASNQRVFVTDDGLDIEPGKSTNIGIKRTIFQKLSRPYSDCIDDLTSSNPSRTDIMNLMFDTLNETQYTQKFCQKLCYQMFVEQNASCSDPSIPQIKSGLDYCINSNQIIKQEIAFKQFYSNPDIYCGDNCPIGIYFQFYFFMGFI